MDVHVWDQVFVRARRVDVHPLLVDPVLYRRWWPHLRTGVRGGVTLVRPRPSRAWRPPQRWLWRVTGARPAKGVYLDVAGDFVGDAEWFYLDGRDGTHVHYVLRATTRDRGGRRRVDEHRACVRAGMNALKDRLEAGRAPGAEPDPVLLADQAAALAAFRADCVPGTTPVPSAGAAGIAPAPPADPGAADRTDAGSVPVTGGGRAAAAG